MSFTEDKTFELCKLIADAFGDRKNPCAIHFRQEEIDLIEAWLFGTMKEITKMSGGYE